MIPQSQVNPLTLGDLEEQIRICRKCRLWKAALNAVPGEGPQEAKLVLVGQNPGIDEDKLGKPFVGRAGKFLTKVLTQNCIDRQTIFVTNIVKHKTPKNRKPFPDEVEACDPFLQTQLEIIQPKTVVLMGTVAWQTLRIKGIDYIETVHPSAAMRFTKMRKRFMENFKSLTPR